MRDLGEQECGHHRFAIATMVEREDGALQLVQVERTMAPAVFDRFCDRFGVGASGRA